jgi:hypothetical protein
MFALSSNEAGVLAGEVLDVKGMLDPMAKGDEQSRGEFRIAIEKGAGPEGGDDGAVILQLLPLWDGGWEAAEDVFRLLQHPKLSVYALGECATRILNGVGRVVAVVVPAALGPGLLWTARARIVGSIINGELIDENPEGSDEDAGDLEGVGQLERLLRAYLNEFRIGRSNEPLCDWVALGNVSRPLFPTSCLRGLGGLTTTCGTSRDIATWATVHIRTAEFRRSLSPLMALRTRMMAARWRIGQ